MIYLDNAATTMQKPFAVSEAAARAIRTMGSPGRGGHQGAMLAAEMAYKCREAAAGLFGVDNPENIVFTLNATHALNIAIKSLAQKGTRVLISGYEHNAVLRPLHAVGAKITVAASKPFDSAAILEEFERKLGTAELVVVNHVSNVFGFVLPLDDIARMCRERGVPFIVDASQSAGVLPLDYEALGAEYLAMPGHKGLYGPQGTGILIARCGKTLIEGGSGSNSALPDMPDFLPDRFEAGTHNMPGISGLYEGIKFVRKVGLDTILRREKELIAFAGQQLSHFDDVRLFLSPDPKHQSGVLSFNIREMPSEQVAASLSEQGIAVRAGLHCAPLAHTSAGTLEQGTVRISVSVFNLKHDIQKLTEAVRVTGKKFK